jgi:hypothetical protein
MKTLVKLHEWLFHSVNWYWRWQVRRQDQQQRRQSPEEYKALSAFILSCLRTQSLNVMDWNNMHVYETDGSLLTALEKRYHPEVCRSVQQAFAVNWLQNHRTLVSRQCG